MAQTFSSRFFSHHRAASLCLAAALATVGLRPARADTPKPEPAALAQLQSQVANLGYSPVLSDDKQSFAIAWTGDYSYKIHFDLSADGTLGYAYVDVEDLTPAQLAKLNFIKLLEESDIGNFYFSMENNNNNGETLYANAFIPLSGMSQQTLRNILQNISDKLKDSSAVWDTSQWK